MGTLGILGALAGGYADEAFRQKELQQRQDLNQRKGIVDLLGQLASNEQIDPAHRAWAAENAINVINAEPGKKVKVDFSTLPPGSSPGRSATQVTPSMQLPPMPGPPPGTTPVAGAVPSGAPVPPPPIIPGSTSTVQEADQATPAGQLHIMTPQELALEKVNAIRAAAQAAGINLTPEQAASAVLGIQPPRPVILPAGSTAIDTTGRVIATGQPKPLPAGQVGMEPKFGPGGEFVGVIDHRSGRLLTGAEIASNPEAQRVASAAQEAIDAKEKRSEARDARVAARTLANQTNSLVNAMQLGAVNDAKKAASDARIAYNKMDAQLKQDENRYQIMQKLGESIQKNPANVGSFDAALLAFHMGMTVGQVKGMRTGQQLIELHAKARSMGEQFDVALNRILKGEQLSPEQRQNFIQLAQEKMETSREQVMAAKSAYERAYHDYQGFVGTVGKGKVKMPSAPPGASTVQSPEDEASAYLQSLGRKK